ncbi:MAG: hypothetical protein SCALA702_18010 [Melioribacteraceae bacterium]|nr:MAG: hypothetical protein SCALA702_18010 [Melioribacteraceae bacterium]
MNFTAIDFETADQKRDSACAVSLVKVKNSKIVDRQFYLIKPPRRNFIFSYLHGITYDDVKKAPNFGVLWKEIESFIKDSDFLAAHNSSMDKSVLKAVCALYNIPMPDIEFRCSMKYSREKWEIYPTRLENVISRLNLKIPETPYKNAEACALIFLHEKASQVKESTPEYGIDFIDSGVRVNVLGSSSAGNSTLIRSENAGILVDIGFVPKYLMNAFSEVNFDPKELKGAVITHLHGDHVKANTINYFAKNNLPVYIHSVMKKSLLLTYKAATTLDSKGLLRELEDNKCDIADFYIEAFDVPHDAAGGCFGYNIYYGSGRVKKKISIATDIGYTTDFLVEKFSNSDVIIIESNHDIEMLENSNRSLFLKQRIKSSGHLSNIECRNFLFDVFGASTLHPSAVILAHLSRDCNMPGIANRNIISLLEEFSLSGTELIVSSKDKPTKTVYI